MAGKRMGRMTFEQKLAAAAQSEPAVWTSDCPEPDDLIALIERGADTTGAMKQMAHIALCAYCRREYAAMERTLKRAARAMRLQEEAETQRMPIVPHSSTTEGDTTRKMPLPNLPALLYQEDETVRELPPKSENARRKKAEQDASFLEKEPLPKTEEEPRD